MDVLELLRSDHQKISNLFDRCLSAGSPQERWQFFRRIQSELLLHSFAEETVFYPPFTRFDETRDLVEQSFKDHEGLKDELERIDDAGQGNPRLEQEIQSLRETVEEHVDQEEKEFFPQVRKLLRRNEREQLGRHVQAAKEEPIAA